MAYFDSRWWPPPSRPRPAKGGIRSRSRRGGFGASWWARRWIEVLEGFPMGGRLQRGRTYARKGQVVQLEIDPGEVTARVQGSRARPYRVRVALTPLAPDERRAAGAALASRARLAAGLLAGEMPREMEAAFGEAGVPLFPERGEDLVTDCSCPDPSNPCKHIAAVYYLVAEELDRDPFLLLRLRGFSRQDLEGAAGDEPSSGTGEPAAPGPPSPVEPLPAEPGPFWSGAFEDAEEQEQEEEEAETDREGGGENPTGPVHLRALGPIPFWRGGRPPEEELDEMVRRAAPLGAEVLAGEEGAGAGEEAGDGEGDEGAEG